MNDIKNNNLVLTTPDFERVRQEPNILWQTIHKHKFFEILLQATVGIGTFITFTAAILPASIVLTSVSLVALLALGLCSPALLHPGAAKIWTMAKNKIFGLLSDLFYLPKVISVTPFAFKPNFSAKVEKGNGPLVVFVHGFLHNKTCWESQTRKLQEDTKNDPHPITLRDIYAINLGEPLTVEEIDHYARYLATMLEQIRFKRGLETLDIVLDAHSMGGLVSAHFATTYAHLVGVNVLRIISNGTPWHGTPMAYIGSIAKCGKEMLPEHTFHKELTKKINETIKDKIYVIASKGDTIVPYNSALGAELDIPEDHRITLDVPAGHLAMNELPQSINENMRLIKEAVTS